MIEASYGLRMVRVGDVGLINTPQKYGERLRDVYVFGLPRSCLCYGSTSQNQSGNGQKHPSKRSRIPKQSSYPSL